jgi:hypothetical protein
VGPLALAVVVALTVGAFTGSVVTRSIVAGDDGTSVSALAVGRGAPAVGWDARKLEAIAGRVLAEQVRVEQPITWDTQKLEAMEGRALADQFRGESSSATQKDIEIAVLNAEASAKVAHAMTRSSGSRPEHLTRDGPVYAAGQCGASRPRETGTWPLSCVDPRGRYSNSWQDLVVRLQSLVSQAGVDS